MKGWVGLVGWPIADGLPTLVVTHQLQVEHRTGKVRLPETDVLPLCHATNRCGRKNELSYKHWQHWSENMPAHFYDLMALYKSVYYYYLLFVRFAVVQTLFRGDGKINHQALKTRQSFYTLVQCYSCRTCFAMLILHCSCHANLTRTNLWWTDWVWQSELDLSQTLEYYISGFDALLSLRLPFVYFL